MSEIGSATFGLVVGLGRFRSDLAKARKDADEAGRDIGDELADGTSGGIEDGGGGVSKAFSGVMAGLAAGAAAAGVAAGAALMAGTLTAIEQGQASDKLAAQLGLSEERSAELGKVAGSLYADAYGESFADVNEAIRSVLQSGAVMEDIDDGELERITAKAIDLGTAFDQEVGRPAEAAGQLIRNGLAANADEAFDIITRGFQQGADKAGDLLDTYREYSTMFRDIGIDGETATGLLVQGLQAGARDADTVADALKEFAIRGQDASEATAAGFRALGLDAEDMTAAIAASGPSAARALDTVLDKLRDTADPVKRNAAAVALFGTKAEDLGDALFSLDPSAAVAALGDVAGASDRLGTTLNDNAATKLEAFKRGAMQGLVDFIGGTVIPGVEGLVSLFQEEGLGGVVDALGARISEAIPVIKDGVADLLTGLRDFVVENGPVFLEGLADLLGMAVGWLTEEGLPMLGEGAKKLVPALVDWIANDAIPAILTNLPGVIAAIAEWVAMDAVPAILGLGADIGQALLDGIGEALGSAVEWGADVARTLVNALIRFINTQIIDRINDMLEIRIKKGPIDIGLDPPDIPHIPTLDAGGIVPGPRGAPQLILAHGGETVAPTHRLPVPAAIEAAGLGQMVSQVDVDQGNDLGGRGGLNFNIANNITAPSPHEAAAAVHFRLRAMAAGVAA